MDYIRDQLLETYIKIEKKFKFKNKGIIYLLKLFNQDVTKMLQFYHNEKQKLRTKAAHEKKLQREQDLAVTRDHTEEDEVYPLPSLNKNLSAINKYTESINDRESDFYEPYTSLTVKKRPTKSKLVSDDQSFYENELRTVDYLPAKKSITKIHGRNNSMQSIESIRSAKTKLDRGLT